MKLPVIFPALIAERRISRQPGSPLPQTADAGKIVTGPGSTDEMRFLVRARAGCVRPSEIPDESPGHGGTRGYALRQEFWYNEGNGKVMEQYRNQLPGTKADAGGWLSREERVGELPGFSAHVYVRFAGNQAGRRKG